MNKEAWPASVHGVTKSQIWLSDWTELMQRADSLEKTLMLGKIEGRRTRGQQRMRWLDGITNSMDTEFEQALGDDEGQGGLVCIAHGVAKSQTPLSDWIDWLIYICDKVEHSYIWYNCYCSVNKLCPVLCNPMDCSLPYSSVHEISQARVLVWVAIFFSGGSSWAREQTHIFCIGGQILYHWTTREALCIIYLCLILSAENKCLCLCMNNMYLSYL